MEEHLATHFYHDNVLNADAVKLLPGEYFFTKNNKTLLMSTVLGSCVSACIWDPLLKIGGMNHFMLPADHSDPSNPVSPSMRYGTYAMEILINELIKAGAKKERLQAKVFGGGKVLENMVSLNVGERNAAFVLKYLHMEKIPILAQDLNDIYPRKIIFDPQSGKAMMKKLKNTRSSLIEEENKYAKTLNKTPAVGGSIDLF